LRVIYNRIFCNKIEVISYELVVCYKVIIIGYGKLLNEDSNSKQKKTDPLELYIIIMNLNDEF
jgi:hypothetical protein